jgi:hypothetical protein
VRSAGTGWAGLIACNLGFTGWLAFKFFGSAFKFSGKPRVTGSLRHGYQTVKECGEERWLTSRG